MVTVGQEKNHDISHNCFKVSISNIFGVLKNGQHVTKFQQLAVGDILNIRHRIPLDEKVYRYIHIRLKQKAANYIVTFNIAAFMHRDANPDKITKLIFKMVNDGYLSWSYTNCRH